MLNAPTGPCPSPGSPAPLWSRYGDKTAFMDTEHLEHLTAVKELKNISEEFCTFHRHVFCSNPRPARAAVLSRSPTEQQNVTSVQTDGWTRSREKTKETNSFRHSGQGMRVSLRFQEERERERWGQEHDGKTNSKGLKTLRNEEAARLEQ